MVIVVAAEQAGRIPIIGLGGTLHPGGNTNRRRDT